MRAIVAGTEVTEFEICGRACNSFYEGGPCMLCNVDEYVKIMYNDPYIYYICQSIACIGTEYEIKNTQDRQPKLCFSKAMQDFYPYIPENKVFTYNIDASTWNELFVDNSKC